MTKWQTQRKRQTKCYPSIVAKAKEFQNFPAPDTCLFQTCQLCLLNLNCEQELSLRHAVTYPSRKHFLLRKSVSVDGATAGSCIPFHSEERMRNMVFCLTQESVLQRPGVSGVFLSLLFIQCHFTPCFLWEKDWLCMQGGCYNGPPKYHSLDGQEIRIMSMLCKTLPLQCTTIFIP